MLQGEIINLTIEELNNEGEGIARVGDERFVVFVPGALPSENADVRIVAKKKSYALAKLLKINKTSDERVRPFCKLFGRCGGCQLQHLSYTAQLKLKTETVYNALTRIGKIDEPNVHPCVPSPSVRNYRNKASMPVQSHAEETLTAGFYKARTHEIVKCDNCPILDEKINTAVAEILSALKACGFAGVKKSHGAHNEIIREIVIRKPRHTNDMLCAVVTCRSLSGREIARMKSALEKIKGLSGACVNVNTSEGNFIWGEKNIPIFGKNTATEKLCGYSFTFEASSFFQVNTEQTENLYKYASELALAAQPSKILELYSGTGTLTAFLLSGTDEVTAVESWEPAAKYILPNAKANGLTNIIKHTCKSEEIAEQLSCNKYDAVVLDPPRTGCDRRVIEALIKIAAEKIIYISCNPATLARDVKLLCENGYALKSAQPFDMFPHTSSVETVVLLGATLLEKGIK